MTKRAEKWPVIGDNGIIRGGLGLVTDKTKKKPEPPARTARLRRAVKKKPNPQQEPLAYGARLIKVK